MWPPVVYEYTPKRFPFAPVVLATTVGLWLAWLKRRERAEDRALTVRAVAGLLDTASFEPQQMTDAADSPTSWISCPST